MSEEAEAGFVHIFPLNVAISDKNINIEFSYKQSNSSINLPFHHQHLLWHPSIAFPASPFPEIRPSWPAL
jgi:hypothetical protein